MFNPNDIQEQLYQQGNEISGAYNQLQWSVRPGTDYTDIRARITSVHEFLHNELNNISGYGFLLQIYAYLSKQQSDKQIFYQQALQTLVDRCRFPHEAYATWLGITVFRKDFAAMLPESILADNREYLNYYHHAEYLTRGLKSLFLKQQVVSAAIRFCFQSRQIAESAINDLDSFHTNLDTIKYGFPDSRFTYLIGFLPEDFFIAAIESFITSLDNPIERALLHDALQGKEHTTELLKMENNHLALGLMSTIYHRLQKHFDEMGASSLNDIGEHIQFYQRLLVKLEAYGPFTDSPHQLIENTAPDDFDRNMVLNFENERLLFSDAPLPCMILFPDEINEKERSQIITGKGQEPHLFIMGRYRPFLEDQYYFTLETDKEWFNTIKDAFTAIRYAGELNGVRTVVLIPFKTPEDLEKFLVGKPASVPLIAGVSFSAVCQQDWWQQWSYFFEERCTFSCLLADISPLYYIEQVFPGEEAASYTKIIMDAESRIYTALLFTVRAGGQLKALLLAPGSDMYCQVVHHFIQSRYPVIKKETIQDIAVGKYLPMILSHIVREEQYWYFHSQDLNFGK